MCILNWGNPPLHQCNLKIEIILQKDYVFSSPNESLSFFLSVHYTVRDEVKILVFNPLVTNPLYLVCIAKNSI